MSTRVKNEFRAVSGQNRVFNYWFLLSKLFLWRLSSRSLFLKFSIWCWRSGTWVFNLSLLAWRRSATFTKDEVALILRASDSFTASIIISSLTDINKRRKKKERKELQTLFTFFYYFKEKHKKISWSIHSLTLISSLSYTISSSYQNS